MRFTLISIALMTFSAPVSAQTTEVIKETRCWLGSLTFSPNSTIRASDKVMICALSGLWEPTDKPASGCIREGKLYSIGSVEGVPNSKSDFLTCDESGVWKSTK